jgi:hypothetical protein
MDSLQNVLLVLISPREVFEYLKEKPSWWLPLVLIMAITVVFTVVTAPIGKEIALEQINKRADTMSSDQLEQTKQIMESPFLTAFSAVGALVAVAITVFIEAGIVHFLLSALGGSGTFVMSLAVVLYASVPMMVRQIIESVYAYKMHSMMKTGITSIFAGVDPVGPMGRFLGSVDIFVAWQYILLAIGCSIVYKVSKGKTGAVAFGIWAAGVVISVGLAFLGTSFG